MAEIKTKQQKEELEIATAKKATDFRPWLENKNLALRARTLLFTAAHNKVAAVRKVVVPRAARAAKRFGAPAGVALIIFLISLSLFLPKDSFQQIKEKVTRYPYDSASHLLLAEKYLANSQFAAAEKELLLVDQMQRTGFVNSNKEKILGTTIFSLHQLWQKKRHANPADIKKLITYWKDVVAERPNYRDAYLQLAALHYKLYWNERASQYLQKALTLDPNFPPAREIEKRLTE